VACWPREQAGRRQLLWRRWQYNGRGNRKRGAGGRQMTAKVVAHSVGSEKALRWKNDNGAGASPLGNGGHGRSSAQSDRRSEKRQRE